MNEICSAAVCRYCGRTFFRRYHFQEHCDYRCADDHLTDRIEGEGITPLGRYGDFDPRLDLDHFVLGQVDEF